MKKERKPTQISEALVALRKRRASELGRKVFHKEMGALAGVSRETWGKYESGEWALKIETVRSLAKAGLDVSGIAALLAAPTPPSEGAGFHYPEPAAPSPVQTGDDDALPTGALPVERHLRLVSPSPIEFSYDEKDVHVKYEVVPRYSVRVSAGRGIGEGEEEQVGEFAFEVDWMRRNLGRSGRGFASVEVHGDSMQPTLLNGDEIIIDRQVVRVSASGIYVIGLRGDLLVKRVQVKLDGSLVVKSDNPAYEPETITAQNAEDFRVVGRMVWPRVR